MIYTIFRCECHELLEVTYREGYGVKGGARERKMGRNKVVCVLAHSTQYTVRNTQYAVCSTRYTTHSTHHIILPLLFLT